MGFLQTIRSFFKRKIQEKILSFLYSYNTVKQHNLLDTTCHLHISYTKKNEKLFTVKRQDFHNIQKSFVLSFMIRGQIVVGAGEGPSPPSRNMGKKQLSQEKVFVFSKYFLGKK